MGNEVLQTKVASSDTWHMMYQSDLLEMFPVIHHIFFNRVFALHYFLTRELQCGG